MSSSHQDPVCKPCTHSPLHRPQRRYTAHCGRLRYPAHYRSLIARCPLRSSAPLAWHLVTPRSLRYLAPSCMLREGGQAVRYAILHPHCGNKHRHLQRMVRLQKTMLAYILFAAAAIASLVRANQRNGSSSCPHVRELPPSCLVADPLSVIWRKAIRLPAPQQVRHAACISIIPPAPPKGDLF
jgi:hypothetical protein